MKRRNKILKKKTNKINKTRFTCCWRVHLASQPRSNFKSKHTHRQTNKQTNTNKHAHIQYTILNAHTSDQIQLQQSGTTERFVGFVLRFFFVTVAVAVVVCPVVFVVSCIESIDFTWPIIWNGQYETRQRICSNKLMQLFKQNYRIICQVKCTYTQRPTDFQIYLCQTHLRLSFI